MQPELEASVHSHGVWSPPLLNGMVGLLYGTVGLLSSPVGVGVARCMPFVSALQKSHKSTFICWGGYRGPTFPFYHRLPPYPQPYSLTISIHIRHPLFTLHPIPPDNRHGLLLKAVQSMLQAKTHTALR